MQTSSSRRQRWLWLGLLLALFIGTGAALLGAQPAAAQANQIFGHVTGPDGGLPPVGTTVLLASPDGVTHGQAAVDPLDGSFTIGPAANGGYLLQARPPAGGELTPSLPLAVMLHGAPFDAGTLALTLPSITGTLAAPDGVTPADGTIHVFRSGLQVMSSATTAGAFQLGGLLTGTYHLVAQPQAGLPFWQSPPTPVTVSLSITQTVDLQLQAANAVGTVVDPQGVPVPGATVHVLGAVHHAYQQTTSGAGGFFSVGELTPDTYLLLVEPPWWADSLIASEIVVFNVPPDFTDLGAISLRDAPKVLRGSVTTNTGTQVEGAAVIAHRVGHPGRQGTVTNAQGNYTLHLGSGLWAVTVEPTDSSNPANWIYADPPLLVYFDYDLEPELKSLHFTVLTADSTVIGVVAMPDGGVPPFTTTVRVHNNEGQGRTVPTNPADGSFAVHVPNGNYVLTVQADDPGYSGPPPLHIYAPVSDTVDVGILTLLAKDATIGGNIVDENGAGVAGVHVVGWTREHQGGHTSSGPDGSYGLGVVPGEWLLRPIVPPEMPYVFLGAPLSVTVGSMETVSDADFVLNAAPNLVQGQLVTTAGDPVMARGTVVATDGDRPVNHAPISGGSFALFLPDGSYDLAALLGAGAEWLAGAPQEISVSGGETISVSIPVLPQDATINGVLWDPRNEEIPTGVAAFAVAYNPFTWVGDVIDPANGTYHLDVSAGLWRLGYGVAPDSGYVTLDHHLVVPIESGQSLFVPLPVAQRDSVLTGVVRDPDGLPLAGAVVIAAGAGSEIEQVNLRTHTNADGEFRLPVPYGRFNLRAGYANDGWLNPAQVNVLVPPGATIGPIPLQFRLPDATLSGTASLAGRTLEDGRIHIWAYSDDGAATWTSVLPGETYSLGLLSGQRWHIGAVYETPDSFYAVRTALFVAASGTLDLVLEGPYPKPAPVAITFDPATPQSVTLADGTRIFIPAGALPATGQVTLHITPIATFPHQHHARLYKYGYAFIATDETGLPLTASFNQNVIISFSYEDAELSALNLNEQHLKPAYFATSTQTWTVPESYVVDTAANRVTMQIDHFTDYALINSAGQYQIFLPSASR